MTPRNFLKTVATGLLAFVTLGLASPRIGLESRAPSFDYNNQKVRGVNLGGWLVTEPWITPSIYEAAGPSAIDEWTLCEALGGNAKSVLETHWSSFITASDFSQMASAGLNHVRIPVGYWSFTPVQGEPYVQGAQDYLDQAIGWARAAGLKVLIDLHGAQGSQNGFDNSGHKGAVNWGSGDNIALSIKTIRYLANRYAGNTDVVTIINLVNEPLTSPTGIDKIKQYYLDGWGTIRESHPNTVINFNDAFQGISYWQGFPATLNYVMLGVHYYQIFSNEAVAQTIDQHVADACGGRSLLAAADKWTTVSEWSGAITDCAKYLNGRYIGARYDGTYGSPYIGSCAGKGSGSVASLSTDDRKNIRRYIEAQLDTYEAKTGWFYWTWKTEGSPEWDMQDQIAGGLFPQPIDSRQYPGQCG